MSEENTENLSGNVSAAADASAYLDSQERELLQRYHANNPSFLCFVNEQEHVQQNPSSGGVVESAGSTATELAGVSIDQRVRGLEERFAECELEKVVLDAQKELKQRRSRMTKDSGSAPTGKSGATDPSSPDNMMMLGADGEADASEESGDTGERPCFTQVPPSVPSAMELRQLRNEMVGAFDLSSPYEEAVNFVSLGDRLTKEVSMVMETNLLTSGNGARSASNEEGGGGGESSSTGGDNASGRGRDSTSITFSAVMLMLKTHFEDRVQTLPRRQFRELERWVRLFSSSASGEDTVPPSPQVVQQFLHRMKILSGDVEFSADGLQRCKAYFQQQQINFLRGNSSAHENASAVASSHLVDKFEKRMEMDCDNATLAAAGNNPEGLVTPYDIQCLLQSQSFEFQSRKRFNYFLTKAKLLPLYRRYLLYASTADRLMIVHKTQQEGEDYALDAESKKKGNEESSSTPARNSDVAVVPTMVVTEDDVISQLDELAHCFRLAGCSATGGSSGNIQEFSYNVGKKYASAFAAQNAQWKFGTVQAAAETSEESSAKETSAASATTKLRQTDWMKFCTITPQQDEWQIAQSMQLRESVAAMSSAHNAKDKSGQGETDNEDGGGDAVPTTGNPLLAAELLYLTETDQVKTVQRWRQRSEAHFKRSITNHSQDGNPNNLGGTAVGSENQRSKAATQQQQQMASNNSTTTAHQQRLTALYELRYLRIRDFRRRLLSVLNYFASVYRAIALDCKGESSSDLASVFGVVSGKNGNKDKGGADSDGSSMLPSSGVGTLLDEDNMFYSAIAPLIGDDRFEEETEVVAQRAFVPLCGSESTFQQENKLGASKLSTATNSVASKKKKATDGGDQNSASSKKSFAHHLMSLFDRAKDSVAIDPSTGACRGLLSIDTYDVVAQQQGNNVSTNIIVQNHGSAVMDQWALSHLEELDDKWILQVGSFYIGKHEEAVHHQQNQRKQQEEGSMDREDEDDENDDIRQRGINLHEQDEEQTMSTAVDHLLVLQDLYESELWFAEGKLRVINNYREAYAHCCNRAEQTALANIMLKLIFLRPRLNLSASYFTDAYTQEAIILELQHTLLREITTAQLQEERRLIPMFHASGWNNGLHLSGCGVPEMSITDTALFRSLFPGTSVVNSLDIYGSLGVIASLPAVLEEIVRSISEGFFQTAKFNDGPNGPRNAHAVANTHLRKEVLQEMIVQWRVLGEEMKIARHLETRPTASASRTGKDTPNVNDGSSSDSHFAMNNINVIEEVIKAIVQEETQEHHHGVGGSTAGNMRKSITSQLPGKRNSQAGGGVGGDASTLERNRTLHYYITAAYASDIRKRLLRELYETEILYAVRKLQGRLMGVQVRQDGDLDPIDFQTRRTFAVIDEAVNFKDSTANGGDSTTPGGNNANRGSQASSAILEDVMVVKTEIFANLAIAEFDASMASFDFSTVSGFKRILQLGQVEELGRALCVQVTTKNMLLSTSLCNMIPLDAYVEASFRLQYVERHIQRVTESEHSEEEDEAGFSHRGTAAMRTKRNLHRKTGNRQISVEDFFWPAGGLDNQRVRDAHKVQVVENPDDYVSITPNEPTYAVDRATLQKLFISVNQIKSLHRKCILQEMTTRTNDILSMKKPELLRRKMKEIKNDLVVEYCLNISLACYQYAARYDACCYAKNLRTQCTRWPHLKKFFTLGLKGDVIRAAPRGAGSNSNTGGKGGGDERAVSSCIITKNGKVDDPRYVPHFIQILQASYISTKGSSSSNTTANSASAQPNQPNTTASSMSAKTGSQHEHQHPHHNFTHLRNNFLLRSMGSILYHWCGILNCLEQTLLCRLPAALSMLLVNGSTATGGSSAGNHHQTESSVIEAWKADLIMINQEISHHVTEGATSDIVHFLYTRHNILHNRNISALNLLRQHYAKHQSGAAMIPNGVISLVEDSCEVMTKTTSGEIAENRRRQIAPFSSKDDDVRYVEVSTKLRQLLLNSLASNNNSRSSKAAAAAKSSMVAGSASPLYAPMLRLQYLCSLAFAGSGKVAAAGRTLDLELAITDAENTPTGALIQQQQKNIGDEHSLLVFALRSASIRNPQRQRKALTSQGFYHDTLIRGNTSVLFEGDSLATNYTQTCSFLLQLTLDERLQFHNYCKALDYQGDEGSGGSTMMGGAFHNFESTGSNAAGVLSGSKPSGCIAVMLNDSAYYQRLLYITRRRDKLRRLYSILVKSGLQDGSIKGLLKKAPTTTGTSVRIPGASKPEAPNHSLMMEQHDILLQQQVEELYVRNVLHRAKSLCEKELNDRADSTHGSRRRAGGGGKSSEVELRQKQVHILVSEINKLIIARQTAETETVFRMLTRNLSSSKTPAAQLKSQVFSEFSGILLSRSMCVRSENSSGGGSTCMYHIPEQSLALAMDTVCRKMESFQEQRLRELSNTVETLLRDYQVQVVNLQLQIKLGQHQREVDAKAVTRRAQASASDANYAVIMQNSSLEKENQALRNQLETATDTMREKIRVEYEGEVTELQRQLMLSDGRFQSYKKKLYRDMQMGLEEIKRVAMLSVGKMENAPLHMKRQALKIAISEDEVNTLKDQNKELRQAVAKTKLWYELRTLRMKAAFEQQLQEAKSEIEHTRSNFWGNRETTETEMKDVKTQLSSTQNSLAQCELEVEMLRRDLQLQLSNKRDLVSWKVKHAKEVEDLQRKLKKFERWNHFDLDRIIAEYEKAQQQQSSSGANANNTSAASNSNANAQPTTWSGGGDSSKTGVGGTQSAGSKRPGSSPRHRPYSSASTITGSVGGVSQQEYNKMKERYERERALKEKAFGKIDELRSEQQGGGSGGEIAVWQKKYVETATELQRCLRDLEKARTLMASSGIDPIPLSQTPSQLAGSSDIPPPSPFARTGSSSRNASARPPPPPSRLRTPSNTQK